MPKYTFMVLTNPVEGQEDTYNDWYTNRHLADVLNVPGFVSAQRFKLADAQRGGSPQPWRYLALYQIDTDDLKKTLTGSDLDAIKSATEKLMAASQSFSQKLYEAAARDANAAGTSASGQTNTGASGAADDEIVDAEIVEEDGQS